MRDPMVLTLAILSLGLGACDSIRGAQMPAATTQDNLNAINAYYRTITESPQSVRNKIIETRIAVSNDNFTTFTKELREAKIGTGFGSEVITIILGAVGAVTGTAATKSILSAASAGVAGTTASFDKHVFYKQTVTALIAQMSADRDAIKVGLLKGMAQDINQYPLIAAINQLQNLDNAGSIEMALSKITEKATKEAKEQSEQVVAVNIDITRTPDDSRYMFSEAGLARVDKLVALVDQLARTNPTKIITLAQQPTVKNDDSDKKAAAMLAQMAKPPTALQAARVVKFRIRSAKGSAELTQWEADVK